jgi:hypothetical protein
MSSIKRSLQILSIESVITTGVFAMPILTSFFQYNIGMSLGQIALSQSAFTAALMILNVPTGWIADRFSRKACNIAGDLICAIGFLGYSQATTFSEVVLYEIVLGVGLAFSGGADNALFKAYAHILKISFEKHIARITSWRFVMEILAVLVGGYIGASQPRTAIALSAVQFFVGAILSLFIREAGERRITEVHPVRDMVNIGTYALHGNKQLATRISALVIGRESTHHLVWLLTPLLLFAGVPGGDRRCIAWAVEPRECMVWQHGGQPIQHAGMQDWRIIASRCSRLHGCWDHTQRVGDARDHRPLRRVRVRTRLVCGNIDADDPATHTRRHAGNSSQRRSKRRAVAVHTCRLVVGRDRRCLIAVFADCHHGTICPSICLDNLTNHPK